MEAAKEEVDTKVGDDNAEEGQGTIKKENAWLMVDGERGMQWEDVDDKGDECPNFLGIPSPIVAPRDVGP